jgi:hypothetical protein
MEYWDAMNLCYGRQEMVESQGCLPDAHTRAVSKAIIETMIPIVKQCIFN